MCIYIYIYIYNYKYYIEYDYSLRNIHTIVGGSYSRPHGTKPRPFLRRQPSEGDRFQHDNVLSDLLVRHRLASTGDSRNARLSQQRVLLQQVHEPLENVRTAHRVLTIKCMHSITVRLVVTTLVT